MTQVSGATAPTLSPTPSPLHKNTSVNLHCLLATSLVSLLLVLTLSSSTPPRPPSSSSHSSTSPSTSLLLSSSLPLPPSLAYLLSGSHGDADRLLRLLRAVYHPRNLYLLHLDLSASPDHRRRLVLAVQSVPAFRSAGNVHVVGNASFANPRGSSALAATLRGASVLLRLRPRWDWFVNLDASDYPLVTQDDHGW